MATDKWKNALDEMLSLACTKLEPKDLKPYFYEDAGGFLTEEETIRVCGADGDSRIERVQKLFKILKAKKHSDFLTFCSILDRMNCSEIAAKLRERASCPIRSGSRLGATGNKPILSSFSNDPLQEVAQLHAPFEQKSLSQPAPPQRFAIYVSQSRSIEEVQTKLYLPTESTAPDFSLQSNGSRQHNLQSSTPQSKAISSGNPSILLYSEETVADIPPIAAETNLRSRDKEKSDKLKSILRPQFAENSDLSDEVHELTPKGLPGMNNAQQKQKSTISKIHPKSKSYHKNSKTKSKISSYSIVNDEIEKERTRRNTEPATLLRDIIENPPCMRRISRSISEPDHESRSFSSSKPSPSPFTRDQMLLLTVPDLLAEHDKDWEEFGLMLDINPGELNKIKKRYNNEDHMCVVMLECLSKDKRQFVFSVLEQKLSKSVDEWSQTFWTAIQKKAAELGQFRPQLDDAISCQVNETLLAEGIPDEWLIQSLSKSDAVANHYWRIARLLGLSIDAMEHIEESVTKGQLKKKVLEVFRKWKEIQGGSTLCLFQVLHYLKIDLQPFVGHMNAINGAETDSATSMNDQFPEPTITTALLTATKSEYNTVLGYFGVEEQIEPAINFGVYLCSNDPSLEGNPPEAWTLNVNELYLIHVERLLLVSFPAVKKAFVVYQPKASQANKATSEMVSLAKNKRWPLKYFYIIGYCSYYAKVPQRPLGQIMLVECLHDYNRGDLTDSQFPVTVASDVEHKMSRKLFQTVSCWADKCPKPEWNVPFEHAKRVCSAPRNVNDKEVASKLLANDSCIAIETEGIGMLTVKDVVDVLQKHEAQDQLEYIVVKGAAHHADRPSEQTQTIQLFNQIQRECGAVERETIATLHSIVLVTRCIVLDKPRITSV